MVHHAIARACRGEIGEGEGEDGFKSPVLTVGKLEERAVQQGAGCAFRGFRLRAYRGETVFDRAFRKIDGHGPAYPLGFVAVARHHRGGRPASRFRACEVVFRDPDGDDALDGKVGPLGVEDHFASVDAREVLESAARQVALPRSVRFGVPGDEAVGGTREAAFRDGVGRVVLAAFQGAGRTGGRPVAVECHLVGDGGEACADGVVLADVLEVVFQGLPSRSADACAVDGDPVDLVPG